MRTPRRVRVVASWLYRRLLPHPCACGALIASGATLRHLRWHEREQYQIGMLAHAASGGRSRKPRKPPALRTETA